MAQFDVLNDTTPQLAQGGPMKKFPSIAQLRAAISGSAQAASYPTVFLDLASENDLLFVVRTHGIAVAGVPAASL